jgi:uncharacterized Zn-finger protein
MQLDKSNVELTEVAENIYKIKCSGKEIKFWTPKVYIPFGIETEYGKKILKLGFINKNNETNKEQIYFENIIKKIETIIKEKFDLDDEEFKSVIKHRENFGNLIETRIKFGRNCTLTTIEFQDKDANYLKTIYDMGKGVYVKVLLEINGVWNYKKEGLEKKEPNKAGLIVYINKIYVYAR